MRFGVLSDTHIPERVRRLPPAVFDIFSGVDRILHAGDIVRTSVLDELSAVAPVTAVRGNMDDPAFGLPLKSSWVCEGITMGLIHGAGGSKHTIRERIAREFVLPQVIVYGHTHTAFWGEENGIWFFNPGSPTDTLVAEYRSVGVLTVEPGTIRGEIIRL